jgi:3-dehydroquinate dehydratase
MKKATFLSYDKPLLCAMVQDETPDDMICTIMDSLYDGADAFGIQLCNLQPEYRTEEILRKIFSHCEGKPIYITSYRGKYNKDLSEEERMDFLLMGLRAGATLCDIPGDTFAPCKEQMTFDSEATEKQKRLIQKIHDMGGEVLISTHTGRFYTEDEVSALAKAQVDRGADVVKIVTVANDEEEEMVGLQAIRRLKKELDRPFLFLVGGSHNRLIRQIGPALGVCMYLCVQRYHPVTTKAQPILRSVKAIRDNMLL